MILTDMNDEDKGGLQSYTRDIMEEYNYQWQNGLYDEQLSGAIEVAIETVEKMRSLPITSGKIKKAREAMFLTDKKQMWDVLQEFFFKYKSFINGLSPVFGYYVYAVDAEFYQKITLEEIVRQLHIVIGYICLHDALGEKVKETFMNTFMKALRRKGFDEGLIKHLKSQLGGRYA